MTNEEIQESLTKLVEEQIKRSEENAILRQAAKIIFKRTERNNGKVTVSYGTNGRYVVDMTAQFMQRYYD
jgi:hypothetical protein